MNTSLDWFPGAFGRIRALPIDHRVFGLHQRQSVPFPRFALSVPGGHCDHPVL